MSSHAQKLISSFLTMLRKLTLMLLRPIDKVDEVDLSRKSSHTTHHHHHHHLNFTSLFFSFPAPSQLIDPLASRKANMVCLEALKV